MALDIHRDEIAGCVPLLSRKGARREKRRRFKQTELLQERCATRLRESAKLPPPGAGLIKAPKGALDKAEANFDRVAAMAAGVEASDGSGVEAKQMIDGGPSVLYGAVAVVRAATGMDDLLQEAAARDFIATPLLIESLSRTRPGRPLFEKAGVVAQDFDDGCIPLGSAKHAKSFVEALGKLRVWGREPNVKMPKKAA